MATIKKRTQTASHFDQRIRRTDDGHADPPDPSAICRVLRALREAEQMTQAELALRAGVPQAYISRWELNRVPRADDLYRLEVDGFGILPGTVYAEAGFVINPQNLVEAVLNSPTLRERERAMIAAMLEAVKA